MEPNQQQATPEEQAMFDMVVYPAMQFIYQDKSDVVRSRLSNGDDPAQAVGSISSVILDGIDKSARKSGQEIPENIMLHAAKDVVGQVVSFGETEGLIDPAEKTKIAEQAFFETLKRHGEEKLRNGTAPGAPQNAHARTPVQPPPQQGVAPIPSPAPPQAAGKAPSLTSARDAAKQMPPQAPLPIASTQDEINKLPSGITRR